MDAPFEKDFDDTMALDDLVDTATGPETQRTAPTAYSMVDVTLESASGSADAIGFFVQGKAGRPAFGQILWARAGLTPAGEAAQIDLDGADAEDIGFFMVGYAADRNPEVADGMMVHFEHSRDGTMAVVCNGRRLDGHVSTCFSGPEAWASATGETIGFIGADKRFADLTVRGHGPWPMDGAVRPWV